MSVRPNFLWIKRIPKGVFGSLFPVKYWCIIPTLISTLSEALGSSFLFHLRQFSACKPMVLGLFTRVKFTGHPRPQKNTGERERATSLALTPGSAAASPSASWGLGHGRWWSSASSSVTVASRLIGGGSGCSSWSTLCRQCALAVEASR